jgi:peptidyl-prolyl cis-trans isomerase C
MRLHLSRTLALSMGILLLAGCDRGPGRLSPDTVAQAGDFTLGVEGAAQLLAPVEEIPNEAEVVDAVAEFWIDFHLLATAVNREGELDRIDIGSVFRQQENQELIVRLRDAVIVEGELPSDEEVEAFYLSDRPGERVQARHILLLFPEGGTPEQIDSVRTQAEELRRRVLGGEDFAALAREFSEDPGSAQRGGDLGFFPRGAMVAPFEEAAFALAPGEVSSVVESQFGLHVIRTEAKEFPPLEEIQEQLRNQMQMDRVTQAESEFVTGLEEPANVELVEGAAGRARALAEAGGASLPTRDANQPLTRYQGGTLSAGEFREFLMNQPEGLRQQVVLATDEQIDGLLRNLTRGELLVAAARERDIRLTDEEAQGIRAEILTQYRTLADMLELSGVTPEGSETMNQAIERRVREVMGRILVGEQDIFPLGGLALPLRDHFRSAKNSDAIPTVVDRVNALRSSASNGGSTPE